MSCFSWHTGNATDTNIGTIYHIELPDPGSSCSMSCKICGGNCPCMPFKCYGQNCYVETWHRGLPSSLPSIPQPPRHALCRCVSSSQYPHHGMPDGHP